MKSVFLGRTFLAVVLKRTESPKMWRIGGLAILVTQEQYKINCSRGRGEIGRDIHQRVLLLEDSRG